MDDLNKVTDEAWKSRDNPEVLRSKFQEVFEDYRGNAVYLFEYANALDFIRKEAKAIPLYQMAIKLGLS